MSDSSPSMQEWADLYEASADFKTLGPWDWMTDGQLFGVQSPEDGEMGYCCVLGNIREVFGLVVYLGSEGLDFYRRVSLSVSPMVTDELRYELRCLMATFESRRSVESRDMKVIKELGLKFRGGSAWPIFRSYEPGYAPWFLTKSQARFLTLALRHAIEISKRCVDGEMQVGGPDDEQVLIGFPQIDAGLLKWEHRWIKPDPPQEAEVITPPLDEVRLRRFRSLSRAGVWEADLDWSHMTIGDKERPYVPLLFLCADQDSGLILGFHLSKHDSCHAELVDEFMAIVAKIGVLPNKVVVASKRLGALLEPVAAKLGVDLKVTRKLKVIPLVRREMLGRFGGF